MAKTYRRESSKSPRAHYPTKRGRRTEVRRSRQEARRMCEAYR